MNNGLTWSSFRDVGIVPGNSRIHISSLRYIKCRNSLNFRSENLHSKVKDYAYTVCTSLFVVLKKEYFGHKIENE